MNVISVVLAFVGVSIAAYCLGHYHGVFDATKAEARLKARAKPATAKED